jgi:DNA-binding MarR family transcriptional regulator
MKIYNLLCKDKGMQTWMLIRQTHILCDQLAEQTLLDTGLTQETTFVLSILDKADKAKEIMIPADLARYTSRANQTLAGLINRMEKNGLVQRIKKAQGHPYTEVVITPKGKQAVKNATKVYEKLMHNVGMLLPVKDHDILQHRLETIRDDVAAQLRLKVINKKC